MRKSQWMVFGVVFFLLFMSFAWMTSLNLNLSNPSYWIVGRIDGAFAIFSGALAFGCWINAWLEGKAEKKKED